MVTIVSILYPDAFCLTIQKMTCAPPALLVKYIY